MDTESTRVLILTLLLDDRSSFLDALDAAGINRGRVTMFSTGPQASGIKEAITAVSEAMPWNAIAKVIIAWIKGKSSREVIFTTKDGQVVHAKGYSAAEVRKLLQNSRDVMVIDTSPSEKP